MPHHIEKKPESHLTALAICESKQAQALHLLLDGINLAYHPGTEASVLIDPDESERITYFVLHWPSAGEDTPDYLGYWIKEYYHGTEDWNMEVRDYVVSKDGLVLEAMGVTPQDDIPITEEGKFIPYILDLAELPRTLDGIAPVSTLETADHSMLLERLVRAIPTVH